MTEPGAPDLPGIEEALVVPDVGADGADRAAGAVGPARAVETEFADGEWHRLHPASPLIRGGLGILAVIGIIVANLRDRIIGLFVPMDDHDDFLSAIIENGWLGWAALIGIGVLLLSLAAFWLSWRMHTVRIGEEAVEVRAGIFVRSHRQARLDRIQGIAVVRPWLARIFGVSRLDVEAAGQANSVQLAFVRKSEAEQLRRDLIRLASGERAAATGEDSAAAAARIAATEGGDAAALEEGDAGHPADPGLLQRRLHEFTDLGAEYQDVPQESLVRVPAGRLIGSLLLSGMTLVALLALAVFGLVYWIVQEWFGVYFAVPLVIAVAGFAITKLSNGLNYHLVQTPDGVRVGSGLVSLRSDTVPPGRIHAVQLHQPWLWRLTGWWEVRITRAGNVWDTSNNGPARHVILPVGTREDAERVVRLLLPTLLDAEGALSPLVTDNLLAAGPGFVTPPQRSRRWRPFSQRRIGLALEGDAAYLRTGPWSRSLAIVPLARIQGVRLARGPFGRWQRVATLRIDTVTGVVPTTVPALDNDEAEQLFTRLAVDAVAAAGRDRSHRWARSEDAAPDAPAAAAPPTHPAPPPAEELPVPPAPTPEERP